MSLRYDAMLHPSSVVFHTQKNCSDACGGWVEPAESEQFVWGYCGVGGLLFVTSNFCCDFGDLGVVEATVEAFSPYANGIYWHITGRM